MAIISADTLSKQLARPCLASPVSSYLCRLSARQARPYDVMVEIRDARVQDAPAACEVLRRSIVELCAADHRNDSAILAKWLANKTPEIVASWITQPGNSVLLATESDNILGVGSVTDAGRITLNYVSPDARFRGVSRALLDALEARAAERATRNALSAAPRRPDASTWRPVTLKPAPRQAYSARRLAIR